MKGVYYDRNSYDADRDDWHQPTENESIIVNRSAFTKFFPELQIQGEIEWQCERGQDSDCYNDCDQCGRSVKLTFNENGEFIAAYSNDYQSHQIDEFNWSWSGGGVREWWFDDTAVSLKRTGDYRSNTGLTADSSRVVAFNRKVEVDSFRGDCSDETDTRPKPGKIWAEFINHPADYRANWTGFAMGSIGGDGRYTSSGGWISDITPVIGDALDQIIEVVLAGEVGETTICRHNRNIKSHIVVSDPSKISLYLCKSCRMRGVRWEEFSTRNRQDTCPYFRRACKSVVDRSDSLPEWFAWSGDNLLSSYRRMQDGDSEAYEMVYVRRKEGFVRRSVLLLNNRTREAVMFRYNGFIPRNMAEFQAKYNEGRLISGYMGTGPTDGYYDNPNDRFLSETKIADAVVQGLEQPLWQNGSSSLISFSLGRHDIEQYAIQKGEINGFQVTQLSEEGEEREVETKQNPSPFYTDEGASYHLIYGDWSSHTVLRHNNEELYRSDRSNYKWFLLRVAR